MKSAFVAAFVECEKCASGKSDWSSEPHKEVAMHCGSVFPADVMRHPRSRCNGMDATAIAMRNNRHTEFSVLMQTV